MHYEDFSIQLDALPGGACRARVIGSPAGNADGTFELPLTRAELEALAAVVGDDVRSRRGVVRAAATGPVAPPQLRDVGARLFRALFSPAVRGRYDESRGRLAGRARCGLRLRLHLELRDPGAAALHALPWEFLLRPDDEAFLALGRDTVVVRHVNLPLAADRLPQPLPLRVLVVPSAPDNVTALEVGQELTALRRAFREQPLVQVSPLRRATLEGLRQAVVAQEFHVLHFIGHGALDAAGEGLLCFTREDGAPHAVSGRDLAQQLRDVVSLRLVVLNACDSARATAAAPFTGAATALLRAGVPAVVAMQFPITDEAALAFSETFYSRLAVGDPVDTAVAEARLAVSRRLPGTLEWGTPVLFLRSPDGRLFEAPAGAESRPSVEVAEARRPRVAWRVAATLAAALVGVMTWRTWDGPAATARNAQPTPAASALPSSMATPTPTARLPSPVPSLAPGPRPSASAPPAPQTPARAPSSASARTLTLGDHDAADLPELDGSVALAFATLLGQETLRVTLSAGGQPTRVSTPALGPGPLDFPGANGPPQVDVLDVDWPRRRATLRVRLR